MVVQETSLVTFSQTKSSADTKNTKYHT